VEKKMMLEYTLIQVDDKAFRSLLFDASQNSKITPTLVPLSARDGAELVSPSGPARPVVILSTHNEGEQQWLRG
jgi:hypothetical protein